MVTMGTQLHKRGYLNETVTGATLESRSAAGVVVGLMELREALDRGTERLSARLDSISEILDRYLADRIESDKVIKNVLVAMRGALEEAADEAKESKKTEKKVPLRDEGFSGSGTV